MHDTNEAPKQYQCRHIFTDGHRCASPCLRQEEFCYYHHTTRQPIANPRQRRTRRSTFDLPLPEDRSAIQSSIGQVLQRIAANDIDPRRAGLLLYGLQIASLNLPKAPPAREDNSREPQAPPQTVEEITIDPDLGILAPRAEVNKPEQRKSSVRLLLDKMERESQQQKALATQTPQTTTIPTLQATEDCNPPINQKQRLFDRSHSQSHREQRSGGASVSRRCLFSNPCHPRRSAVNCWYPKMACPNPLFSRFSTAGATAPTRTATQSLWLANPSTTASSADFPNTLLHASDHFVGLPDGQMGNSEVGHLNLGAGRIVRMDMTRIDTAILDGSFFTDPTLTRACELAGQKGRSLHIIGLLSDGGVHSHTAPPLRSAPPRRATQTHPRLRPRLHGRPRYPAHQWPRLPRRAPTPNFTSTASDYLASVSGRYYAMDRDLRWEKEKQAFDAMVTGQPEGGTYGSSHRSRQGALQQRHHR